MVIGKTQKHRTSSKVRNYFTTLNLLSLDANDLHGSFLDRGYMDNQLTTGPLTPNQRIRRNQLESQIKRNLNGFWEVCNALLEINESRLYRDEYPTFEAYCDDKWHFSERHARRLIFAGKVVERIGPVGPNVSERQLREFAILHPDQYVPTWNQVLEEAKGGKITTALVNRIVKAAAGVTIEIVQTKGSVSLDESSVPLIEASITERMAETQSRQIQHIADNSDWDRLETVEIAAGKVTQKLIDLGLDPAEIIKVTIYKRKEQP